MVSIFYFLLGVAKEHAFAQPRHGLDSDDAARNLCDRQGSPLFIFFPSISFGKDDNSFYKVHSTRYPWERHRLHGKVT